MFLTWLYCEYLDRISLSMLAASCRIDQRESRFVCSSSRMRLATHLVQQINQLRQRLIRTILDLIPRERSQVLINRLCILSVRSPDTISAPLQTHTIIHDLHALHLRLIALQDILQRIADLAHHGLTRVLQLSELIGLLYQSI